MKQFALALMASVGALSILAQNLVPNPSFEEYSECPFAPGDLHTHVDFWESWQESPDFFHVCSNDLEQLAGIPENAWGYQLPITGDAYAGVYTYIEIDWNIREYMAAPLIAPLVSGNNYYMMFFASMYDGGSKESRLCATNNIGMRFFKDPEYSAFAPTYNPLQPDNIAHLNYSEILDDYTNWTLIEGWFTADDDYNWVAIGNFYPGDQTDILILNDEGACSGIYYIENVCVALDPSDCDLTLSTDGHRPMFDSHIYPNPAMETARFSLPDIGPFNMEVYDIRGRIIKSIQNINSDHEINVSTFQKGIYLVRVSNNHFFTTLKLIVK